MRNLVKEFRDNMPKYRMQLLKTYFPNERSITIKKVEQVKENIIKVEWLTREDWFYNYNYPLVDYVSIENDNLVILKLNKNKQEEIIRDRIAKLEMEILELNKKLEEEKETFIERELEEINLTLSK